MNPDRTARELGRHFVAGHMEADELDSGLTALYGANDAGTALAGLPALEAAHSPEVRRTGWWRNRHGEARAPETDWMPTTERFVDPTTQRVMRVWTDPASDARHYVAEP